MERNQSYMQLNGNTDCNQILSRVSECRGEVIMRTGSGDVIDLSSEIGRYALAFLASRNEILADAHIECSDPADFEILADLAI